MTDREKLNDIYTRLNLWWQSIKMGDRGALFAFEMASAYVRFGDHWRDEYTEMRWKDFGQEVLALSKRCGDHSPEDYVLGGLVDGMRRAIEKGELPHEKQRHN